DRARGRATARAEWTEAAARSTCRSRIRRPRRLPRLRKGQPTRRGSRAGRRTTCSSPRRATAAYRRRPDSWQRPHEIDAEAVAVPLEAEPLVERMRLLAPGVGGQHQLVAALVPAGIEDELHHGLADAALLERWGDDHVLDDRRWRSEMPEVVHDEQR